MKILSIVEITDDVPEYVYDLETAVGTFVAGGKSTGILVKNTDSCYVKFPIHKSDYGTETEFMEAQFKVAIECTKYCTDQFKPPMELAFEKYMYPLILFAKKKYAYVEWTKPNKPDDNVHYKGIHIVRRDTCKYVKEELNNIYTIIMRERSKEAAYKASIAYTQKSIKNLLDGNIDPTKLILSKQLKSKYIVRKDKISREYRWTHPEIQQPHVRLAQKMMEKDPTNHPKPPDRVPYLFVEKKGVNLLQCDKVIHPTEFVGNTKIDSLYYFNHQYKKPLDTAFEFMVSDPEIIYKDMILRKINQLNNQVELTTFFKKKGQTTQTSDINQVCKIKEIKLDEIDDLLDNNSDNGEIFEKDDNDDNEISEDLFS